jgi:hypothetical protein
MQGGICLVFGASSHVRSIMVVRLRREGLPVRAAARNRKALEARESNGVDRVEADALDRATPSSAGPSRWNAKRRPRPERRGRYAARQAGARSSMRAMPQAATSRKAMKASVHQPMPTPVSAGSVSSPEEVALYQSSSCGVNSA